MTAVVYSESIVMQDGTSYALVREGTKKLLRVRGDTTGFSDLVEHENGAHFRLNAENAAVLRTRLAWLNASSLGTTPSFGFGDRLGLATPGHIQAARASNIAGQANAPAPLFAQQSVRENARTGRSPQEVMDDAMWGVFQCGWQEAWGADADHLKTTENIAPFVMAGYTFFTVDPGEFVDNDALADSLEVLEQKVNALPWDVLQDSWTDLSARYVNKAFAFDTLAFTIRQETLLRAAAKYGRALAHAVEMNKEIARQKQGEAFDFEVSVDETELPTDIEEHFYIANELQRLKVRVTSLAPRFIGRFEKGVDYIDDLSALQENLDGHATLARHFNYKLSLHSGSDKFSVYPLFAASTHGHAHVKTAGTSYLEALRTLAQVNPQLFREILTLARERYPRDRATYHVSAELERVHAADALNDSELLQLMDEFDARQVLHVTFGSVLEQFGQEIHSTLRTHETEYATALQTHFAKHLKPFIRS